MNPMTALMYEKILTALEDCDFDDGFCDENFDCVIDFMDTEFFEAEVNYGATKLVLFPIEYPDIVVKIPFPGRWFWNDDEELQLEDFCCAYDGEWGWDYCKAEALSFSKALERNLDFIFMKTTHIGNVHGHPIYIQPRITKTASQLSFSKKLTEEKISSTEAACYELEVDCFNTLWIHDFIESYGLEFFRTFNDFLKDCHINDLHGSNIGYFNDKPVIFDYSGYWD